MKRYTLILCLLLAAGCSRPDGTAPATSPSATTQPSAAIAPAPQPSATPASYLTVNDRKIEFPAALLRVSTDDGKLAARLYTDDPPDILTHPDKVNSYDLRMDLSGLTEPGQIAGAVWHNGQASMERQKTPFGIFINTVDPPRVLQPLNATVTFSPPDQQGRVTVTISGTFSAFRGGDDQSVDAIGLTNVTGTVLAAAPSN